MKTFNSFSILALAALSFGIAAQSCSDELIPDAGDGVLKMRMVVNSEVTRAQVDDAELAEKCVIYISNSKGLIHKFKGLENVPSDLWLKSGNYVAEAWTGDSVSASFDKKFYRAYEPFTIHQGVNSVVLNCKIANVVASVNPDNIPADILHNYTVTISNTRGSLDFNADNVKEAHGYYMMPDGDTKLTYTIEGDNMVGTHFVKTGEIPDVQRAHEYVLNLQYNENGDLYDVGGAFITISVDDTELLIEDNIEIHSVPQLEIIGGDISKPLSASKGTFSDVFFIGSCYKEFSKIGFSVSDANAFGLPAADYDLLNLADASRDNLNQNGITWVNEPNPKEANHSYMRLKVPAQVLNRLENGSYSVKIALVDTDGRRTEKSLAIEVGDAPVMMQDIDKSLVRSYSAHVRVNVLKADAANPGIEFRKKGDNEWTRSIATSGNTELGFKLERLTPATTYQVRAVCDGYEGNKVYEFTTEPVYAVPYSSFEEWSTYNHKGINNIPFPGIGSTPDFWSSGNEGSMKMKKTITSQSSDMKHSGSYSAKLQSQFVGAGIIGKFAAGNLFAGDYVETDGMNGVLKWGRPMPTCHPVKLTGYANYRPAVVGYDAEGAGLKKGDMDQGTVYVAIVSEQVDIRTDPKNRALFDKDASYVLGFGQVIWNGNFGADGQLQEFEIPIEWKNPSYSGQFYVIIVASSSLYGDYFTGGDSVMYIDDLTLSYE